MVLIGMLTHQIDLYVECSRQIAEKGLVAEYNKGAGQAGYSRVIKKMDLNSHGCSTFCVSNTMNENKACSFVKRSLH